jgi:hypothetical protein
MALALNSFQLVLIDRSEIGQEEIVLATRHLWNLSCGDRLGYDSASLVEDFKRANSLSIKAACALWENSFRLRPDDEAAGPATECPGQTEPVRKAPAQQL